MFYILHTNFTHQRSKHVNQLSTIVLSRADKANLSAICDRFKGVFGNHALDWWIKIICKISDVGSVNVRHVISEDYNRDIKAGANKNCRTDSISDY